MLCCPVFRSFSLQVTGEPLMRRSDDTVDKLRSRLKAFHQQTQPVIDYYARSGKTVNIDAKQDKDVSIACILSTYALGFMCECRQQDAWLSTMPGSPYHEKVATNKRHVLG